MKNLNTNMKKATCTAKKAALAVPQTVLNVPVAVGRTILSVPKTVAGVVAKEKQRNNRRNKGKQAGGDSESSSNDMGSKHKHAEKLDFINREIVEEQERRWLVRESQTECMKEVITHLGEFLNANPDAFYEEWIAALHPENAEYVDPNRIDHRFYLIDSDHRQLWNEFMMIMMDNNRNSAAITSDIVGSHCDWSERMVEARTINPSYNRTTNNK